MTAERFKREKKWRLLYARSTKLHRARQLGMVLDIPDEYQFMDPELIQVIRDSVDALLAG